MAERATAKIKRLEASKGAPKAAEKESPRGVSKKVGRSARDGSVAAENARLKAELVEARERIADLELRQTEITNRIAWVIDSLHNLAD